MIVNKQTVIVVDDLDNGGVLGVYPIPEGQTAQQVYERVITLEAIAQEISVDEVRDCTNYEETSIIEV